MILLRLVGAILPGASILLWTSPLQRRPKELSVPADWVRKDVHHGHWVRPEPEGARAGRHSPGGGSPLCRHCSPPGGSAGEGGPCSRLQGFRPVHGGKSFTQQKDSHLCSASTTLRYAVKAASCASFAREH